MSNKKQPNKSQDTHPDTIELKKITNILALLLVRDGSRNEQISTLNAVGLSNPEIASLLRTTPNSVKVTISQIKSGKIKLK